MWEGDEGHDGVVVGLLSMFWFLRTLEDSCFQTRNMVSLYIIRHDRNQVLHMSFVHYTWWCPALPVVHPWPVQQSYKPTERDSQINASLFPPKHTVSSVMGAIFPMNDSPVFFLEVTMLTDNPPLFQWGAGQRAHSGGTDWHLRCSDDGRMLAPRWISC